MEKEIAYRNIAKIMEENMREYDEDYIQGWNDDYLYYYDGGEQEKTCC